MCSPTCRIRKVPYKEGARPRGRVHSWGACLAGTFAGWPESGPRILFVVNGRSLTRGQPSTSKCASHTDAAPVTPRSARQTVRSSSVRSGAEFASRQKTVGTPSVMDAANNSRSDGPDGAPARLRRDCDAIAI